MGLRKRYLSNSSLKSVRSARMLRRVLDFIGSSVLLLLLTPVGVVVAVAVKVDSSGPILYRAQRVGRDGRLFTMYKFRTMATDSTHDGLRLTKSQDERVTRVGRHLRRLRIDEIPQLWNIVRGDMSFVGPRPEDPRYVAYFAAEFDDLLRARPGLTSPASVVFADESERLAAASDPEQTYIRDILPQKLEIEMEYARTRSIWTDILVCAETLKRVLRSGTK